jgi:RNA polymerase sigma-70 factor (ECF subfamily)
VTETPAATTTARPAAPPVPAGLRDEDEVHAAYLLYGPQIYRFVLRGLDDAGAAQDVTQETFLKAWRRADLFDPSLSSLRSWLFGIARHTMIDHARAASVRPWQTRLVDPPTAQVAAQAAGETVPDPTERLVGSWVVEEALRRISEHHRVAIVETHLRERPHDEVAADLGVPVGTLRSRVFYGLKALRAAMDEMGVDR